MRQREFMALAGTADHEIAARGPVFVIVQPVSIWDLHMRTILAMTLSFFMLPSIQAAELKVLSGNGARPAVRELCVQFERRADTRSAFILRSTPRSSARSGRAKASMWPCSIPGRSMR
jgi:hypothetical protein